MHNLLFHRLKSEMIWALYHCLCWVVFERELLQHLPGILNWFKVIKKLAGSKTETWWSMKVDGLEITFELCDELVPKSQFSETFKSQGNNNSIYENFRRTLREFYECEIQVKSNIFKIEIFLWFLTQESWEYGFMNRIRLDFLNDQAQCKRTRSNISPENSTI